MANHYHRTSFWGHLMVLIYCLCFAVATLTSCGRAADKSPNKGKTSSVQSAIQQTESIPPIVAEVKTPAAVQPVVNVYIENSGSMNGFINNASGFQDAIQKMMVLLKYHYGAQYIRLNYINTAVHPQQIPSNVEIEDFAVKMLTPEKFRNTGNVHSTDLNDIVKMILNGVDENSISILVSDCIYSIVGHGTTETLLNGCKNKTMGAFLEKTKTCPDLATTIVRLSSHFEGYYWDYQHPSGQASQTLDCNRPYYICVIGADANVNLFNEHISVDEMRGYEDKYVLSCSDFSNCAYSAMTNSRAMAKFKESGDAPYKKLEKAQPHGNQFQFAIGADLSALPMSKTEKLEMDNYDVIKGPYRVVGVYEVDPVHMHPKDKSLVKNYNLTHEIVVSTDQYPSDIIVGVKRDIPQWVRNLSSTDDTKIGSVDSENAKTFGLKYFVEGISDAYRVASTDKDYITKFSIQIKRK